MPDEILVPDNEMLEQIRTCASSDPVVSAKANAFLTKAIELPLNQAILDGSIVDDIYERKYYAPGTSIEFPIDLLVHGAAQPKAFAISGVGRIPENAVRGDMVSTGTYEIGCAIDSDLKYLREGNWDIITRMMQVLEGQVVTKRNSDAWHVILAAVVARNLLVTDTSGTAGFMSRRLLELMKIAMRRNAGGNSTSLNRGKLTRLYVSPEGAADPQTWALTEVDDQTRREIFTSEDGDFFMRGVSIRTLDELGVDQEFEDYLTDVLGATHTNSKVEWVVGFDGTKNDAFINPYRQELELFEDMMLHRQRRFGWYGWMEEGFTSLSTRRVLLGQF